MNNSTFEEQLALHGTLVYTNVGDSMMPLLRQNRDIIVIRRKSGERCRKYDVVLYRRPSGQCVLHRIMAVGEKEYTLCGDNRWKQERGVREEWILGTMTAVVRDGKEIQATDWRYQIYVHLWCDLFYLRAGVLCLRSLIRRLARK